MLHDSVPSNDQSQPADPSSRSSLRPLRVLFRSLPNTCRQPYDHTNSSHFPGEELAEQKSPEICLDLRPWAD